MTRCVKCGHDPDAPIGARWSFTIERDPPSANRRSVNTLIAGHAYRRERDMWCWELRAQRLRHSIPRAQARRRVTIVRWYGGRQRERDQDNLVGGMKACVDALVLEGLIADDKAALAEIHYRQHRQNHDGGFRGLEFTVEEFERTVSAEKET